MSLSATFSVSVPTTDQVLARIKDRLLVAVGQESGAGFTFIECVALVAAVSFFQSTIALGEPDASREESALYHYLLAGQR